MRYLLFILFIASVSFIYPQNITIKVIDGKNDEPIPHAHICFESLDKTDVSYQVFNENGEIENNLQKPAQVAISFIGYVTLIDTVYPNQSYKFKLNPSVFDVEEVVVTGQYFPQKADKSIYDVKVVGKNHIEGKAANNLNDLLSNELSMRTSLSGVLGSTVSLQGLSGEHVKILVDGVPVIGRMNGNLDLNQLNLQSVDHVEIVEGPMSVVYGSNALAGAINIITKNDDRKKLSLDINTYYETVGIYNIDLLNQFKLGKHNFQFSLNRDFFGGYSDVDSTRVLKLKPKVQYGSDFTYSVKLGNLDVRYRLEYFNEELRNKGPLNIDSIQGFITAFDEYHYTERLNNKLFLNYKVSENIIFEGIFSNSFYEKRKKTMLKDLVSLNESFIPDTSRHDTTSFNVMLFRGSMSQLVSNQFEYQIGYDINLEDGSGKRLGEDKSIDDYAGFLSLKYKPLETLSIQPGLRIIHNTKYEAPLVYSLNLLYNPIENFNARFSYGKGFRAPSLKELYLNFVDASHNIQGNANLEAEYADNFNTSFGYKFEINKKSNLEIENKYFYNVIVNKIDYLYYANDPSRADMINIDDGDYKTIGGQLNFIYSLHPRLTYSIGMNRTGSSTYGNLDEFTYYTDYTSTFNYKNVKYQFRMNIYYKYSDKIKKYVRSVDDLGEEEIYESFVKDYHMLDFTFSYPFLHEQLFVSVGLKNILDNKSVESAGGGGAHSGTSDGSQLVAYGRTFFIKLNYKFSKY